MIDETLFAFGLDTERFSSDPARDKWMDWEAVALHENPRVTFVCTRAGVSWAYQDPLFSYNWDGISDIDTFRLAHEIEAYPVGRSAYHVLYPGESPVRQYDNFMRIVGDVADWEHDRLVIDLELDHGQSKRTITDCTKRFAYKCHAETGRYPILYGRTLWMNQYTYPQELAFMEFWGAHYRWPLPWPLYTPEHEPPLNPLPFGFSDWLIKQTAERGKPIGSPVKRVMDYNRWNGGAKAVAEYFGHETVVVPEPPPLPEPLPEYSDKEKLDLLWEDNPHLHKKRP